MVVTTYTLSPRKITVKGLADLSVIPEDLDRSSKRESLTRLEAKDLEYK